MKRFILPLLLLGLVFSTGCASTGTTPAQQLVQYQTEIQAGASLATDVALLNVTAADRVATAREVYEVAAAINTAVGSGSTLDLTQVQALAQQLLAQWNSPYEIAAGAIVNVIFDYVQSDVNQYLSGSTASVQAQDVLALLSSASTGVMNTSLMFTQGVPTFPTGVKTTSYKGVTAIVVKHAVWTQPPK